MADNNSGGNRQPIERIAHGKLCASIWENAGDKGKWWSVTFERCYKASGNTQWQWSNSMNRDDLCVLSCLATQAYLRINQLHEAERNASQQQRDGSLTAGSTRKNGGNNPANKLADPPANQGGGAYDDDVPF